MKLIVVAILVASSYSMYAEGCVCSMEYNPVCGSDGQTYASACALECAQSSDPSIQQVSVGECEVKPLQRPVCTCSKIFMPVCGSNQVTYTNICMFECAQLRDSNLMLLRKGPCTKN